MTKTNVQPIPSNSQHHDTPNNKTHVIKFRVTAEEKASLEGRTVQAKNRKAECCVLFPGGRTGAAGEIKECAYDQSENRPGVPVPDSSSDR